MLVYIEYARVKIAHPKSGSTDYINASFIQYQDGDDQDVASDTQVSRVSLETMRYPHRSRYRRYISTQGPLPDTFADFWQVVWEQNSRVLVMLTKQEEMNKVSGWKDWFGGRVWERETEDIVNLFFLFLSFLDKMSPVLAQHGECTSPLRRHYSHIAIWDCARDGQWHNYNPAVCVGCRWSPAAKAVCHSTAIQWMDGFRCARYAAGNIADCKSSRWSTSFVWIARRRKGCGADGRSLLSGLRPIRRILCYWYYYTTNVSRNQRIQRRKWTRLNIWNYLEISGTACQHGTDTATICILLRGHLVVATWLRWHANATRRVIYLFHLFPTLFIFLPFFVCNKKTPDLISWF